MAQTTPYSVEPDPQEVVDYILRMIRCLADLAAHHGDAELSRLLRQAAVSSVLESRGEEEGENPRAW